MFMAFTGVYWRLLAFTYLRDPATLRLGKVKLVRLHHARLPRPLLPRLRRGAGRVRISGRLQDRGPRGGGRLLLVQNLACEVKVGLVMELVGLVARALGVLGVWRSAAAEKGSGGI